jgi:hypothetical protein
MSELVDPLISFTRVPTPEEEYTLFTVLSRLLMIARKERGYRSHIKAPEEWRIMERLGFGHGFALSRYGVIYRTGLDSQYLPAVMAHIIGWYNKPGIVQPAYEIAYLRNMAASFELERLPGYSLDSDDWIKEVRPAYSLVPRGISAEWELYYDPRMIKEHRRKVLKSSDSPEQLRPQPVDVVLGGGNNYTEFSYRLTESYSGEYSEQKEDSARGLIAVMEYLDAIVLAGTPEPRYTTPMWSYFRERKKHAEYFKKVQRFADGYAQIVFGMAGQLADLLQQYAVLSQADGEQTVHFYQSLPVRISYLKRLASHLV